jgi:hypothetical protein
MVNCDKCGKEIEGFSFQVAVGDKGAITEKQLGKYYKAKTNVNLILAWNFCAECLLDALFNEIQCVPVPINKERE